MMASHPRVSLLLLIAVLAWSSAATADAIREVRLETSDLVYDPAGNRIYASIPSSALSGPNNVVRINPDTGAIEAAVPVGTNPGKLALSSNGQYLYVAVTNGTAVQRITLATLTADPPFLLGNDSFFGAYSVEDMAVVPDNPGVIAVSRKNSGISPRHAGVAVYDNGVQRPATTPRHTGANVIEFGSATRLYGYNTESTEFGFRRMVVDASGVTVVDVTDSALRGFSIDIAFAAGRVYASNGQVIDGEARTLVGHLAGSFSGPIRPDAGVGRIFGLEADGRLLAWDVDTFRLLGAMEVPTAVGEVGSLTRWGSDGLAFRTDRNQLFLVRTSLVAGAQADVGIAVIGPEAAPQNRPFAYALAVTNNGPASATDVLVQDQLPAGVALVSASASQGTCTGTATVMCALGDIAPGAIVIANVIVRATATQPLTNTATVSATTTDPHTANNSATLLTTIIPATTVNAVRRINLATGDLVLDRATGSIYASLPGDSPAGGNSVVAIDPATGALGPPVFVGSEPGKLALSDDGQLLYVSLDGAAAVRRVDVASATAGLQFGLGSDSFFGPYYVEDMAVMPGAPNTVAISRQNPGFSPRHAGVAVYDNGVKRVFETARHTGSNVIEFSQVSPTRLYGYNNETTEFGFRRMLIDANGVGVVDVTENLILGFSRDFIGDADRVYTTAGQVIDPEARLSLGTFTNASGAVRPDSGIGRVFFFDGALLRAFDIVTRVLIGSAPVDGVRGDPRSLIRWGGNGLAFRTSEGQLFLIESSLASGDTADLAITMSDAPDPVSQESPVTFTIRVENRGPRTATGVVVSDTLPSALVAVSAAASQGTCSTAAQTVTCNLGSIANGASATVTLVARTTLAGMVQNTATVTAATFDTVTGNNSASTMTIVEPRHRLTVTLIGSGRGTVVSDPAGIQCGTACSASFDTGSVVTLDPRPEADSYFAGWTGDPDCADGRVTMTAPRTCTARFSRSPDLVVTTFSGPAVAGAGQRITVQSTVRNQAAAPASAGPFTVGFYLTPDPGFDPGHARLIGSRSVAGLNGGAVSTAATLVTIPEDFFECVCTLVAVADDGNTVPELNEDNNVRLAIAPITITRPDLVVTALTGPVKAGTSQKISISTTVRNLGRAAVPHAFTVGLYLSANQAFDRNEARLLGRRSIASLGALGVSAGATMVTVPADLTDGAYFLFAMADDGETVFEADEANNVFMGAKPLMVVRPDLAIGTATASATAARVITVSAVVQNRVTPSTPPGFAVGFYLSPTQAFDPATARLLQRRALTGLAGGTSMTVATTVGIPADVAGGMFYAVVVADDGDAVIESDEGNNVRVVATPLSVVPPDLAMTAISGPAVAGAGRVVPIVTTVRNLAAWTAPGFMAGIYLSPTPEFDRATSRLIGTPHTASLGARMAWTATTSVTIPADMATGDYYIAAVADDTNALVEVTRDNNVLVADRPLKVVRPDLTVSAVTGPTVAATGQAIGVMVTAQNLAIVPGDARSFTIGVYLGTAQDAPGPRVGSLRIAALAAGRSVAARISATIPLGTEAGAHLLTARVDDADALPELDETNNALVATAPIDIVRPDLQLTAVTAPAMLIVGQTISVVTTVKNVAPTPSAAGPFSVDIFLVGQDVDPTAPCTEGLCPRRVGGRTVARLGPGAVSTAATAVKVPVDMPPGIWVVHVIVDVDHRVPEVDETNNTITSSALTILPDVRGTVQVSANGVFDACTDPSLVGPFFLPPGPLAITSQIGDRISGTATFLLPTTSGVSLRFAFRLTGTVEISSFALGSYAVTVSAGGVVGLTGEGTFQGQIGDFVDLVLGGPLRDRFDECHMILSLASFPTTTTGAASVQSGGNARSPLPRLLQRAVE